MDLNDIHQVANADFPTKWGHFRILGFEGPAAAADPKQDAVALVMGDLKQSTPLVRIHSQCLTGDVFHSLRCDCRRQLELALSMIGVAGTGIFIYEQQEGRGIGLMAKLRAYELQDQGLDTVEANLELGFKADLRGFELPAAVLRKLGVDTVRLITNNPEKVRALESAGIRVAERVSAEVEEEESFRRYLEVKRQKLGHLSDHAESGK